MEEVREEIVVEEVEVMDATTYSDEEIDAMCATLKSNLKSNGFVADETCMDLAYKIAKNSKDYLDNDTYLWTMYTYALSYKKSGNVNAERFCYIRMRSVLDAMCNKREEQKALTFVSSDFPNEAIAKVFAETAFMDDEIKSLKGQFLKLEAAMGISFFGLMIFLFKMSWITALLMIAVILFVNYKVSYGSLVSRFVNEQTSACQEYCNHEELITFDLPVYNS